MAYCIRTPEPRRLAAPAPPPVRRKAPTQLHLHPRQSLAFLSGATEILYGGAAGGGKSHLMRVKAIALAMRVPGIQIYIFRRLSDDLLRNHMEGDGGFYQMLATEFSTGRAKFNASKNFIRFTNGSKIWLAHCQHEKDVRKYQGAEFHVLIIDELTHFTEYQYRFLRARCRLGTLKDKLPDDLKTKLPLVLSGTNPGGPGHTWVRATFIDPKPPMLVYRTDKEEGGFKRQFIPALLTDNPSLDQESYRNNLSGLGSPELVKAMLEGDWDIVQGGALDDVWDKHNQIKPRFRIPEGWRISRAFDWGSSHPFSVGWYAEADGTEAQLPHDEVFCPPKGSLIRFYEWYGGDPKKTNVGLKMAAKEIARGILETEKAIRSGRWVSKLTKFHPGPADNQIYNVVEKQTGSIAKLMAKEGVLWCRSEKGAGSRINGLQHVRDYLTNATNGEGPGLYFTENCRSAISSLPQLPRDPKKPDDVDTKSVDHVYDETRYMVLHQLAPPAHHFPVTFTF